MRMFKICIIAALVFNSVCGVFYSEKAREEEIICEIFAVLDDSGMKKKVTVKGTRFAPDSEYFTDIKVVIDDIKEIIPQTNEGYGAGVEAFDFKGEGYSQLFYFASSGGSGGFGYFYVFDCSSEQPATIFDYKNFINVYSAQCYENTLNVYCGKELFVTYDLSVGGTNCGNDTSRYSGYANVTELNFLEPVFVYSLNYYRLNAWQNIIVGAQVNVVGRIITTLVYDKENNSFIKEFASVFGK